MPQWQRARGLSLIPGTAKNIKQLIVKNEEAMTPFGTPLPCMSIQVCVAKEVSSLLSLITLSIKKVAELISSKSNKPQARRQMDQTSRAGSSAHKEDVWDIEWSVT